MIKLFLASMLVIVTSVSMGCAHTHEVQGTETKSEVPEGVRVGIGGKEVKEGEKVDVLAVECKPRVRRRSEVLENCNRKKIGEALVLKVLDHDSAIVQPNAGFAMDSTMEVERQ